MSIKQIAVYVLITAVVILTFVSVLSIWDVFTKEVLGKSLSTIGVIAFGAFIVVLASQAIESRNSGNGPHL